MIKLVIPFSICRRSLLRKPLGSIQWQVGSAQSIRSFMKISTLKQPLSLGTHSQISKNILKHRLYSQSSKEWVMDHELSEDTDRENDEDIESTTGMIEREEREGLVYFDHLYPPIARFHSIQALIDFLFNCNRKSTLDRVIKYGVPKDLKITVKNFVPRKRDGGAFLSFKVKDNVEDLTVEEAEKAIFEKTSKSAHRTWFTPLYPMRVFEVKGVPWIEDLRRFTTNKIKVVFEGDDLNQETLYTMLRRYGPIMDIEPPPPGMKDLPRYAIVTFSRFSDAPTARNCVNGQMVNGTKVHLSFVQLQHRNLIFSWLMDHPRIVIPIALALLAGLAVIIFEPIRVWFVKKKIEGFSLHAYNGAYSYVRNQFQAGLTFVYNNFGYGPKRLVFSKNDSMVNIWEDRVKIVNDIRQWVKEGSGTYIIVLGPRGSGKENLVLDHALKDCRNVLSIDCETLVKSRTDHQFIKNASNELGYFPVFPFMNSMASLLDLGVQGLTGQKSGFAESTETQFKAMLSTAITSIYQLATAHRSNDMPDKVYLQQHPEVKPVIVIKHFMSKSENYQFINKQISEWTSNLIQADLAHVIFITNDVSSEKVLSNDLPNQVFKTIAVGDATESSAKRYILKQLKNDNESVDSVNGSLKNENIDLDTLDEALKPIGGHMTDIEAFARRVRSGEGPISAVNDMVHQSSIEILQRYLMRSTDDWSREQVWTIIKLLGTYNSKDKKSKETSHELNTLPGRSVNIGILNSDPNFNSVTEQQHVLRALESSEMIFTENVGGRIISIRAAKPLYQAGFEHLLRDKTLSAWMEIQILNTSISKEENKIKKIEEELVGLAKLPSKWEVKSRINYLATKLYSSQTKIQALEKNLTEQKKVLAGN